MRVFESDTDALALLKRHGIAEHRNGFIRGDWWKLDQDCRAAVQYLVDEWDFEFENTGDAHG